MDIRAIIQSSTLRLSADRHVIFHLRHHWHAGMLNTFYSMHFLLIRKISQNYRLIGQLEFFLDK